MDKVDKIELIKYETPTIAEFISIGWIRNIIASHVARKINRKLARYQLRQNREKYLKEKGFIK